MTASSFEERTGQALIGPELYLRILEGLREGIAVIDAAGTVLHANGRYDDLARRLGGTGGILPDLASSAVRRTMAETGRWQAGLLGDKEAEERFATLEIAPLDDPQCGNGQCYVVRLRDVTPEVLAEKRFIEELNREHLARIVGGLAHDFNNLLWTIAGSAEIALDDLPDDLPAHEDVSLILKASQLGKHLLNQIFSLAGPLRQENELVDLAKVIDEVLDLMRATLPPTMEVRRELDAEAPLVEGDKSQLTQLLVNLCKNASQAMRARQGVLVVSLSEVDLPEGGAPAPALKPGPYLALDVRDNGRGMLPELVEHVFEPFFSMKASGQGVGIGLTVVRQVAENHGGAVAVKSSPGKGTSFTVFLPKAERLASPAASYGASPSKGKRGGRVLIAAGLEEHARMLRKTLEKAGFQVHVALDPEQAVAALGGSNGRFDAAVADLDPAISFDAGLPDRLRARQNGLKVIILTPDPLVAAGHAGAERILKKPLEQGELVLAVEKIVSSNSKKS